MSLLKMYVKTLIMDPKQLEPLLQPNVHGHAYFGWHCWRPSGCLWSSLFPHTTRYSTSISTKLTKVIFQNKFSDTLRHFQLTQLTSSSCPRPLLPRSQSFSLFWWASANWPMMTTFTNLYFLDNQYFWYILDVLIFPPKLQRQSSSILVPTDGPQLEETRQVGDDSCWFVYEIMIWTQPSGPLRLWQCL